MPRLPPRLALAALLLTAPVQAAEPGRHALIIAIGAYPSTGGYPKLSSGNDVQLMRGALERQGFEDIVVLQDAAATVDGIRAALGALATRSQPGDYVVVHYSGHGNRMTDDNPPEETDGYDEALAPYDALAPGFKRGADAEVLRSHLRDDELGGLLDTVRTRIGTDGQLVVSLDSCFSGSATRSVAATPERGIATPIGDPAPHAGSDIDAALDTGHGAAPMIVLTAARAWQKAQEASDVRNGGLLVGALSLSLSHALADVPPGSSWRRVYERVHTEMSTTAPNQDPTIEGPSDAEVFGGHVVAQAPFVRVARVDDVSHVHLAGGSLVGLSKGATVMLMPAGSVRPDAHTAVATGRVEANTPADATVRLDAATDRTRLEAAWAFPTEYPVGDFALRVGAGHGATKSDVAALKRVVDTLPAAGWADLAQDLLITPSSAGYEVRDRVTDAVVVVPGDQLGGWLTQQARARFLRRLSLPSDDLNVRASIGRVPVATPAGTIESIRVGDQYTINLTNQGRTAAWVNVIDIMADGSVSALFPSTSREDNRLDPGRTLPPLMMNVTPPPGLETIKVIVTSDPLDMSMLLGDAPPVETRGSINTIVRVLRSPGNTAIQTRGIPLGEAEVQTLSWCVIDPGANAATSCDPVSPDHGAGARP